MTRKKFSITKDYSRNQNLSDFSKAILKDRYLFETEDGSQEDYQDCFARIASYFADDESHANRLYEYLSKGWFMAATPVLTNGGAVLKNGKLRGLPISCFLNEVEDTLESIINKWSENAWLAARGGGIGTYWGNVRSIGEGVSGGGKSSGVIPFFTVQDSLTVAISQGNLRRGSAAIYLPVWHPEVLEFVEMRKFFGAADPRRKCRDLHHGIVLNDEFMNAVVNDEMWYFKSPKTDEITGSMRARDLWVKILVTRLENGEPYILYIDNVNKNLPESYKKNNMKVKTSNLCSEITLATGRDYLNKARTAVCCLSSLNLEYYDHWKDNDLFIMDIMRFLDNVLQSFIDEAGDTHADAVYAAKMERSVGLGVMGYHSLLQSKMIPFEDAKDLNIEIFKHIKEKTDEASYLLAKEKGAAPDSQNVHLMMRFANTTAIAPTASISIILDCSPSIEPWAANLFTQKTLTGSFRVRNKYLEKLFASKNIDTDQIWSSIANNFGSVAHLDCLSEYEKKVFKTAFEIDQYSIINQAADRGPYISQAQSLNIFLDPMIDKKDLHLIHFEAWRLGVKSLYYCRSRSIQRAEQSSSLDEVISRTSVKLEEDECKVCQ